MYKRGVQMNKKGSLELSVNSIVILIIAIAMLGLILGFVRAKFQEIDIPIPTPEPQAATINDPITLGAPVVKIQKSESVDMKFSMYNKANAPVTVTPSLSCSEGLAMDNAQVSQREIPAGSAVDSTIIFDTASLEGKYLCTITVTGIGSEDFTVEVQ